MNFSILLQKCWQIFQKYFNSLINIQNTKTRVLKITSWYRGWLKYKNVVLVFALIFLNIRLSVHYFVDDYWVFFHEIIW